MLCDYVLATSLIGVGVLAVVGVLVYFITSSKGGKAVKGSNSAD
jgi:hypothetical protein